VLFAFRVRGELRVFGEELRAALEKHSSSDGEAYGRAETVLARSTKDPALVEMNQALDEIFLGQDQRARVLAMNELSTLFDHVHERARLIRSALPRIPILSGAAAAIFVLALGVFAEAAWPWAGLAVTLGFLTSLAVSVASRGAHRSAQQIRNLLEVLARRPQSGPENTSKEHDSAPISSDLAEMQ
jgi:hypothetical protein